MNIYDYQKVQFVQVSTSDQTFTVEGFSFKSKTFLSFLVLCVILSGMGLGLLFTIPTLIIIYPLLYSGLYHKLTRYFIKTANSIITRLLSVLPNVEFNGEWYQELYAEKIRLNSFKEIIQFIKKNLFEISIIHLIFLIYGLRFGLLFQGGGPSSNWGILFGFTPGTIIFACILLPFLTGFYFIIIWSIEDAGLKLYKLRDNQDEGEKFNELTDLSDSFRTLSGLLFGIPNIFWFLDYTRAAPFATSLNFLPFAIKVVLVIVTIYFLTIGVTLFSIIIYYRGDDYQKKINDIRVWVRESSRDYSSEVPVQHQNQSLPQGSSQPPRSDTQTSQQIPNFCRSCGEPTEPESRYCIRCGRELV